MTPVVATLLTALPEIMPNRLEPTTAILAAPPRRRPVSAEAMSVNHSEAPDFSSSWPKNMNMMTMVQMIVIGMPNMATGIGRDVGNEIVEIPACAPAAWPGMTVAEQRIDQERERR